ncbi:hypothetical protein MKZ38_001148 [Zalerion maritima]|uniref:Uncharacterized protein n=1 Tax=Zalerion maritima TaxID=339359 RepID=A0AAD5RRP7_9PEZI|nr:hypothetical protein MKZ38_001148 [Zalerion maritima]
MPPPGPNAASRHTNFSTLIILTTLLLTLLPFPVSAVYPPTSLLYRPSDNQTESLAYLFLPDDSGTINLYGLNASTKLDVSSVSSSWSELSTSLPFVDERSATSSFSPSIADDGTLYVFAGDCSEESSELWAFELYDDAQSGSWTRVVTLDATGPYFLGSSTAFSTTLEPAMGNPTIYSWGGMCPIADATEDTWVSNATYTSNMTKIRTAEDEDYYSSQHLKSEGPVAEAGFTFTALSPIEVTAADTITQQVNLMVLGGHTSAAFVNMSTAAVWSLPEESWGFVYISDPSTSSSGELAMPSDLPTSVDPRSGHTAVLSEDGSTMVVYGGWIGDTSTAAQPQLAIVNIGVGYGGTGRWSWEIPDSQPEGPGIYGHGAALLPGNTMMVYGGYNISGSLLSKRTTESTVNSNAQFFNLTSGSWLTNYTNPNYNPDIFSGDGDGSTDDNDSEGEDNSSNQKKLGLGLGIGLGLSAALGVIFFFFCYRRRLRRHKSQRDETVRSLAQDHRQFLQSDDEEYMHPMAERGTGFFPWSGNGGDWYTGGGDAYSHGSRSLGYETLRNSGNHPLVTGWASHSAPSLAYQAPPVTRKPGLRTPKGYYVPGSSSGEFMRGAAGGRAKGSGPIHPIYEADEEMEGKDVDEMRDSDLSPSGPSTPTDNKLSDPFATPTQATVSISAPAAAAGIQPKSPERGASSRHSQVDPDVEDWTADVNEAEKLLNRMTSKKGRTSPSRVVAEEDNRTTSNLSDRSATTVNSVSSRFRMFGLGSNSHVGTSGANQKGKGKDVLDDGRTGSSDSSDKSFSTARSSFPTLQAEGPSLLFGSKGSPHGSNMKATTALRTGDVPEEEKFIPGSPSKMKPRPGWLGSLRRVFSTSGAQGNRGGQPSPTGSNLTDRSDRRKSISSNDFEAPRLAGLNPALLRRKQGKHAWKEEHDGLEYTPAEGGSSNRNRNRAGDDSDWDIEKAVEQRLVQVMFTVPRERLRVVNAEIEKEEEVVVVDPTPVEESRNPMEDARVSETPPPLQTVTEAEPAQERRSTSGGARRASGTRKAYQSSSRKPNDSARKASEGETRPDPHQPLDVDIAVSDPDVGVQVELIRRTPSPDMASSSALGGSTPARHRRDDSDPFQDPPSASDEVHIARAEANQGLLSLPPINTTTPLSSTLAPSSTNASHLSPSPVVRNPSPSISLPPPTPVRLARDLDRAGFSPGGGLAVPEQHHHDDSSSERTDFTVSSAGGARTAEMVWFERVQRMDRQDRERGREAEEEREEMIRREADRVAAEREGMLQLGGGLLGSATPAGPSTAGGGNATGVREQPGTPGESPRRKTRVLEMVDSIESLRREAKGRGSGAGTPTRSPQK